MKTFENKTTTIKEKDALLRYAQLAEACLKEPPKGGFDLEEMASRLRVLDALKEGKDAYKLEDQDYETLARCVAAKNWFALHPDLVAFGKTFK